MSIQKSSTGLGWNSTEFADNNVIDRLTAIVGDSTRKVFKGDFGADISATDLPTAASGTDGDWFVCDSDGYVSTNGGATFNTGDVAVVSGVSTAYTKIAAADVTRTVSNWNSTVESFAEIAKAVGAEMFLTDTAGKVKYRDALITALGGTP